MRVLLNRLCGACILLALLCACAAAPVPAPSAEGDTLSSVDRAELERQVRETERAFAQTMADRDHAAFTRFLSDEAVFFAGPRAQRGQAAIAAAWQPFFAKPDAPFSWASDIVEVLDSGRLALSSGPVRDPSGKQIATFTSIWRLQTPGVWRIVFDKGCGCVQP